MGGLDQHDFMFGVITILVMTCIGLVAYAYVLLDDRNTIFKQDRDKSKAIFDETIQAAKLRRENEASRAHINELRKYINKATPGGWIGYMRSLDGEDITIYADYKEIKDNDLKPALPLADYDKAIKDATARLQAAAVH